MYIKYELKQVTCINNSNLNNIYIIYYLLLTITHFIKLHVLILSNYIYTLLYILPEQ